MRRCVFMDRDGVINRKPPVGEYVRTWSEFHLIPAVVDWIRLFNALGLLVIVVTNQRGVARGYMTADDLNDIHVRMCDSLAGCGAHIDDVFACIHDQNTCDCRKPRQGLVLEAGRKWNIDMSGSILIGDSDSDQQLAAACGLRFVRTVDGRIQPGFRVTHGYKPSANPRRGSAAELS